MVASHHSTRADTFELKEQIFQRIGPQRANKYFDELNRFLNLKLDKIQFDKCCVLTLGRENIPLHNQLIRAILQNAQHSKTPPQKAHRTDGLGIRTANNVQHKDLIPRRKFRADRPSPLGPLGKSSSTYEETGLRINESPTELQSLSSRPPVEEDGEEVEQLYGGSNVPRWSSITAPHGISLKEARKASCFRYGGIEQSCQQTGMLPDTIYLRDRLQKQLTPEGLGISLDCCKVLNSGLDAFMKTLIEPCVAIARSQRVSVRQNNRMMHGNFARRPVQPTCISMRDFQVAVESNPHILGENWPVQFQKICDNAW